MRLAYLECFSGASGDMFLGALLDAGVPASVLEDAVSALNIGASLRIETVDRSGISATKVHVLDHGHAIEESHEHSHSALPEQHTHTHTHAPKTQHLHKVGHHHHDEHTHTHADGHTHGRSLSQIRALISSAPLDPRVRSLSIRMFELLGAAEAKIHNVPVDKIHFHEVGAVDAIVDIVASCAGIVHLNVGRWHSSPLNVGGGMIDCAHGRFPVPAPAAAELLRGMPTYSAHAETELLTPTGAALLRVLDPAFGPQPAMRVDRIGYGAGTRNQVGFPNVLRLTIGESTEEHAPHNTDEVIVLETALDDCSPQILAFVSEQALALGALDVMLAPVHMKKGRPGTLLTLLCTPGSESIFADLLFRETSTLGIRTRRESRLILEREILTVDTAYGSIRVKQARTAGGEERNLAPEFEDCRAAAQRARVPLKEVQQAALRAAAAKNS
jgi:uncharacterized protein (TIGR00299 family) protein